METDDFSDVDLVQKIIQIRPPSINNLTVLNTFM